MKKSSDALLRMLALLQLIPRSPESKSTSNLQWLLEEQGFVVSMRTLQRDLEKLSITFPLLSDTSKKPYCWSFEQSFQSDLPALDASSALTWVMAEEHLTQLLPNIALEKLKPQFKKAKNFLDSQPSNQYQHWQDRVKAIPNGKALIPAPIDPTVWQLITDAVLLNQIVDIEYLSRKSGSIKQFTIHPKGLVVRHSTTYLLASINDYDNIRQLALHRIKNVTTTEKTSKKSDDFSIENYVDSGAFDYSVDKHKVNLKMKLDANTAWHLSETPVDKNQDLKRVGDNEYLLSALVANDLQTQWWILGFGSKVEVIEPLEWRKAIYEHATEIANRGASPSKK